MIDLVLLTLREEAKVRIGRPFHHAARRTPMGIWIFARWRNLINVVCGTATMSTDDPVKFTVCSTKVTVETNGPGLSMNARLPA